MSVKPEHVFTRAGRQWKLVISIPDHEAQEVADAVGYLLRQQPYVKNRSEVVRRALVDCVAAQKEVD